MEFVSGKYTIIPREVTLQADNKESFVGEALKPLTYTTLSGSIVKGDTVVTLSTSADSKKAGTYDIVGKCINTNYKLTVKVGKYTVQIQIPHYRGWVLCMCLLLRTLLHCFQVL